MEGIRMTEKRFTYIKNSSISQYQSIPIQKIGKGKAFHCQGLVDELNKLSNENEQLKQSNERLLKMLDNVANYMQKENKYMPIDDFVEWWNNIATEGLND